MDLERFKKKQPKQSQPKRSVNDGEIITKSNNFAAKKPFTPAQTSKSKNPDAGSINIFDDGDIFGVWNKQKEIKRQQKQEEQAKKAAKKRAKDLKKVSRQKAKAERKANGAPRTFELSLTMPTAKQGRRLLSQTQKKINYQPSQKKYYIIGSSLVLIPLLLIGFGVLRHAGTAGGKKPAVKGATAETSTKPDFATIKPTTTDNQATTIRYDTTKKVASYNDVLKDVPITVSQQPLPSSFQSDPTGKVAELAKQINANDKISTSDTTAYAGLSIKGPQTVVFTKNDLLIFIYADKQIDVLTWEKYIESMQTR